MNENIILIGMPGVGKSTLGVVLAKELGYEFLDSDLLIQKKEKCLLKDILETKGIDYFIQTENEVNSNIKASKTVIATGGSVIYGAEAMKHLKSIGTIIYLKLDYKTLSKRLDNLKNRGVVLKKGQDLKAIYDERTPLYEKYADLTIDESNLDLEKTLELVLNKLNN